MTNPTPSISDLAKADDLVKRLNDCTQWKMLRASDDPRSDEFDHAPFEAADLILSLTSRVENAETQLKMLIDKAQEWCDAVDRGTSWDDWDYHFKNMKYKLLPAARALIQGNKP